MSGHCVGDTVRDEDQLASDGFTAGSVAYSTTEIGDLDSVVVDPTALARLPETLARRLHALPLRWQSGTLIVAVDNPTNLTALDDIRAVAGADVSFVAVRPEQLQEATELAWRPEAGRDDSIDESPVVRFVNQILVRAIDERASDIHLEATSTGGRVRFRVDGILYDVLSVPSTMFVSSVARLKVLAGVDIAQRRLPQDGRLSVPVAGTPIDVRLATLPTAHGESIVLRLLDPRHGLLHVDDLGFLPDTLIRFETAYRKQSGAVVLTGPTGSGKTTTLYAAVAAINQPERNIVTVEDPVEYQIDGIKQVQVAERAGLSFDRTLRAILRCDPDVILVGEVRDLETARISAEAALTGHLVLSTLHTTDAASTPARLGEMGLEPFMISAALDCVVAQRLVRALCLHCREEFEPTAQALDAAGWDATGLPAPDQLCRPRGCAKCGGTGYHGRFALQELMRVTPEIRELILANAPTVAIRFAATNDGMRLLRVDGLLKVAAARTSLEEVVRVAS